MADIVTRLLEGADYEYDSEVMREAADEIERLRAALREIIDLPGEINTFNYNYDDVVALNNAHIEAFTIARDALEQGVKPNNTEGK